MIILLLFFQDILIILLLFCLFWFNRSYSVNNHLDFILTVIKRDYNTNDWLKFILSFIRQDNGLNNRLKLVKNGRKENWKWAKWRWKSTKQEMNWKSRIRKLTDCRTKNAWRTDEEQQRTEENLHEIAHQNASEALQKHLGLDFLHGNTFFSPKIAEMHSIGSGTLWNSPPRPIYRKRGVVCRPGELACFLLKQPSFQNGPRFKNCYLHPYLDKFTPFFVCFGCFPSKTSRNFTDSTTMDVKPSEAIKNGP